MWRMLSVAVILLAVGAWAVLWRHPRGAVEIPLAADAASNSPDKGPCANHGRSGHVYDVQDFDIPAGTVPQSVFCFDAQAGTIAGWGGEDSGSATPAVKGRMRAIEAVEKLLQNTDLEIIPPQDNGPFVNLRLRPCAQRIHGRFDDVRDYNIPSGETPQSLLCLSRESGVGITWGDGATASWQTPTVSGHMSARDAVDKLLVNTGLEATTGTDSLAVRVKGEHRPK
jgi:hypothetical protein